MKQKAAIIIGASSGIGAELALRFAEAKIPLVLLARRENLLLEVANKAKEITPGLSVFCHPHDVLDRESIPALFAKIKEETEAIGYLVYGTGYLPKLGEDEFSSEKDCAIVEIGLTGAVAWLAEAATLFQEQGSGTICGISSIAGDRGRRGFPAYHAAKAGLSTYLESLYNRLSVKGIGVVTIKPGFIDTDMTKGMDGLLWLISAKRASEIIKKHIDRQSRVAYVPGRWALVAFVIKNIPSFIFRHMKI